MMRESLPLVLTLKIKGVNIHYYSFWGAFTMSALYSGKELLKIYEEKGYEQSTLDPEIIGYELFHQLRVNTFTDSSWRTISHAGLTESAYQYMNHKYPDYDFILENDKVAGFIYLDNKDDQDVFHHLQTNHNIPTDSFMIDFDKKSINFGLFLINDYDDYKENINIGEDAKDLEALPNIDIDFKNLSFEEFKNLDDKLAGIDEFVHNENNERFIYFQILN
ncbi:hypothetical protein [Tannockella kyphosi]|uniref:hypothetical protein n=1 Tax=Tannockella kyphosi TaxID=2899121 RepID=UPI0020118816|nr:hypothetical protein [Tannockella kyphosi]